MTKTYSIQAQARTVVGRKVKFLRKDGLLPASIYGKKIPSVSITVPVDVFTKMYALAGETGLIDLTLEGKVRPVLVHNVQKHAVSEAFLHVEFYQVDLKEKVHASVPLEFIGVSEAVEQKVGVLLTILDEVEVEALPRDLPEHIDVDVTTLKEVGQELKVSGLPVLSGVTILADPLLTVVKVGSLVSKEAQAEAQAEAVESAAAAATETEADASKESSKEEGAPKQAPENSSEKAEEKKS